MKKLLVLALFLNALLLGARVWQELPLSAQAGGGAGGGEAGCSIEEARLYSADADGNGRLQLTDAVRILRFLFAGGPEPPCLAQELIGLTEEQREILSHMSIVDLPVDDHGTTAKTIRFTGVNLQVVNGNGTTEGTTEKAPGTGNLIVGYSELRDSEEWDANLRTGSHNIVVGDKNNFTSYGGVVFGAGNSTSAPYASVTGGTGNVASGRGSSVTGGGGGIVTITDLEGNVVKRVSEGNVASGYLSSVTGGRGNRAVGECSSVTGGGGSWSEELAVVVGNTAEGSYSSVTGGGLNTASGLGSSVTGGGRNVAEGAWSSVVGGADNVAGGGGSSVPGGCHGLASGDCASVSGGYGNIASADSSSVTGGHENVAEGNGSSICGGDFNTASGHSSCLCGGYRNTASGHTSSASGGKENVASGDFSSVFGGHGNVVRGEDNAIPFGLYKFCRSEPLTFWIREQCEDGCDNDDDGLIDCGDPDCEPRCP